MVHQASPVHLFWAPLPSTAHQCPAPSKHSPFFVCLFETGDLAMELRLADLKSFLPQPPKCKDYKHAAPLLSTRPSYSLLKS